MVSVNIDDSRMVDYLRKAIVNSDSLFANLHTSQLKLWKVSIFCPHTINSYLHSRKVNIASARTLNLKSLVTRHNLRDEEMMIELDPLSEYLPVPSPFLKPSTL